MKRILQYTIDSKSNGMTILQYLSRIGYSHAIIVHLKKTARGILVNEEWAYVNERLVTGDVLTIRLMEQETKENILPVSLPLSIIYEDEDMIVVNKPANMPVHPSMGNYDNTLANALCSYFKEQGEAYTFRCVNRLDRDTTGLTILAKHMLSSAVLNEAVSKREIHREYLAIAEGKTEDSGTIDAPIARKDGSAIERQVDLEKGETAVTHYRRIAYENGLSLVSLHLGTGRTHQIRVHMKYIGHPLIGDFLYNPKSLETYYHPCGIKRQALHSYRLQFTHPVTHLKMDFTAPLPEDMAVFFPEFI